MLVMDLMTADPETVGPKTDLLAARRKLACLGITSMPVVDDRGRLCGVVSEADLIAGIPDDPRAHERPVEMRPMTPPRRVEDVFSRTPISVRPYDDVNAAVDIMSVRGFKSLPVVDDDKHLVGMVSRSDVVRALSRDDAAVAGDLRRILADLGHQDWGVAVVRGEVSISGPRNAAERSVAHTVSRTVAGVTGVRFADSRHLRT